MPTHNSLGISASLLVSDLDKTLSNAIKLRMGTSQKKDAKRIESELSKGRALLEKPIGTDKAKVGVIQFVGDDKQMALLAVEASDGQYEKGGPAVYDCADQDQPRVLLAGADPAVGDPHPAKLESRGEGRSPDPLFWDEVAPGWKA